MTQNEIEYTDRWSGKKVTKIHKGDQADARAWTRSLAEENKCKATCEKVERDGSRQHVVSEGSD